MGFYLQPTKSLTFSRGPKGCQEVKLKAMQGMANPRAKYWAPRKKNIVLNGHEMGPPYTHGHLINGIAGAYFTPFIGGL